MNPILIPLPNVSDPRGNLCFMEQNNQIPFDIKRVFYLYGVPEGASRGAHAHRICHQLLIAVSGSFEVVLDDGVSKCTVLLNQPTVGLHVLPSVWASEINFSAGAICLVLASEFYVESDYIRSYADFLNYKKVKRERRD